MINTCITSTFSILLSHEHKLSGTNCIIICILRDILTLCWKFAVLSGLANLESINLSFTVVTDSGLRKLSGLTSLKSPNLDARHVTDSGLAALTSKSLLLVWSFYIFTVFPMEVDSAAIDS